VGFEPQPFGCSSRHFTRNFRKQRNKIAFKLKNDRIRKITFHTFRHWKATTEYAKTKDILHVMKLLGHRNIQNTLLYMQLINFESDEFHSATAKTIQDAQKLVEAGFEYVCDFGEAKLFRKRK
jgi:integrase